MALSKPKLLQQTRLPLLSAFIAALFLMLLANKVHSASFDFDSFTLTYQGAANVPSDSEFLRLTGTDDSGTVALPRSTGRVLYSLPVQFWEEGKQASFETTIKFLIRSYQNGGADGIAFFIAPVGSTIPDGSYGGNLGIFDSSGNGPSLFAVEFDTYSNEWDPSYPHIGIDINSRTSKATTSCNHLVGEKVNARINYEADTSTITVAATSTSGTCEVSYFADLSTRLPQQVQVGISASTGPTVDIDGIHDILSWSFTSNMQFYGRNNSQNKDTHIRQYV